MTAPATENAPPMTVVAPLRGGRRRGDQPADRRRARRTGAAGARPPSSCSTAARPCRSSPGTARRSPARSTTRSCARSRSGCATCARWRSGGPRSSSRSGRRASSTTRCEAQIMAADSKARLEDIYLPYKPKRRTKAQIAREAGLEPLADALLGDPTLDPQRPRPAFVDAEKGVADVAAALDGARAILVERFAEDADLIGELREQMWTRGRLAAKVRDGQGGGRREVRRLLRLRRAVHQAALAPDPGHVPGREGGDPRPRPWSPTEPADADAGRPTEYERDIAAALRHRRPGPARPTSGCSTPSAGPGAPGSSSTSASTCGCGCARRPRTRRSGSSRPTCATCCSPRRPAPAPRWASTRASAPA